MKFLKIIFLFYIALFYCTSISWAVDDWEFWTGNTVKLKVNNNVSFDFIEEFRIKEDMSTFYQYVMYAGTYAKINKYIDTAIWYKFVGTKKHHCWKGTHRYDIDGILKYELTGFKLSNRSRFEHNVSKNSYLYRDRVKISRDFETFGRKYTPYFFNEFFITINPDGGYHENRANVGISIDFFFRTKLVTYYMARAKKKGGHWKNANVLGAYVKMSF
ncbi:MAG: DUF2490 domain-containing protein [Candidatus Omnitrophota bacterium]|nr:MAG: DUF2490 domain-containing protein [Candidatus Omnitrophota bacterium]